MATRTQKPDYEELERQAQLAEFARAQRDRYDLLYAVKSTEKDVAEIKETTESMEQELHDNTVATKENAKYNEQIKSTVTWAWRIIGLALIGAFLAQVIVK